MDDNYSLAHPRNLLWIVGDIQATCRQLDPDPTYRAFVFVELYLHSGLVSILFTCRYKVDSSWDVDS